MPEHAQISHAIILPVGFVGIIAHNEQFVSCYRYACNNRLMQILLSVKHLPQQVSVIYFCLWYL